MELDMIGDGPMDLESGVFDEEMYEEDEMDIDLDIDLEKDGEDFDIDVDFYDELGDEEMNESVKSQVNESLNWFKRFSKYN